MLERGTSVGLSFLAFVRRLFEPECQFFVQEFDTNLPTIPMDPINLIADPDLIIATKFSRELYASHACLLDYFCDINHAHILL